MPGGEPNLMTDDFAGHLTLEHRTGPRDLISFLDEPTATRHNVRRIPHTAHLGGGRGAAQSTRARRSNMHFRYFSDHINCPYGYSLTDSTTFGNRLSSVFSSGGLSSLSPSSRESVDPIAELLSQLSGVRRSTSNTNTSTPTQLQQLQMQLQLERQQVSQARQQLERLPRRQTQSQTTWRESTSASSSAALMLNPSPAVAQPAAASAPPVPNPPSHFLLAGLLEELSLQPGAEQLRLDRSHFVQQLILSTLVRRNEQEKLEIKSEADVKTASSDTEPDNASAQAKTNVSSNRILRGRARSSSSNAISRADANKSPLVCKNKTSTDDKPENDVSR